MALNLGSYLGVAKETTPGTAEAAPTLFLVQNQPADLHVEEARPAVPNTTAFGPLAFVAGIRHAVIAAPITVDPDGIGFLLTALLGADTPSGAGPYVHAFTPQTTQPTLTFEGYDGVGKHTVAGGLITQLQFAHTPEGFLEVTADGLGIDKVEGGAASTPTLPSVFFQQSQLVATVGGVDVSAYLESLQVTIGMAKEALTGFGSATVASIAGTGENTLTCNLVIRDDGTDRFTGFLAATAVALDFVWTNGTNVLEISVPNAVLSTDPTMLNNKDLATARVALDYEGIAPGTDIVTVTATNQTTSY